MTDFIVAMLAGASAGMVCDVALFPLDTVKSRLQAPEGFTKAGGFRGIYKGLGIAAVGSAPGAALFFVSYETAKKYSEPYTQVDSSFSIAPSLAHMFSASIGEFVSPRCAHHAIPSPAEIVVFFLYLQIDGMPGPCAHRGCQVKSADWASCGNDSNHTIDSA